MNTDEMTSWEKLKTEPIISQMMTPIANPFTALIR